MTNKPNFEIYLIGLTALIYTSTGMDKIYTFFDVGLGATMLALILALPFPQKIMLRFAYSSTFGIALLTTLGVLIERFMHNFSLVGVKLDWFWYHSYKVEDDVEYLYVDDLLWFLLWLLFTLTFWLIASKGYRNNNKSITPSL